MPQRFRWTTFDLNDWLPASWQQDVRTAATHAEVKDFPRTPVVSREGKTVLHVPRGRVHASQVRDHVPWLYKAYRNEFLELAGEVCAERVSAAQDERYGVVLNVQSGTSMRFECHVDSNPLTGLLFCTDHTSGGELVVAHDPAAEGLAAVERSCSVIQPRAGQLIVFSGRSNPHYARALMAETDTRIVAVMNYYTESCPEAKRPPELNRHLYGDK
jgi:hypothetical protein